MTLLLLMIALTVVLIIIGLPLYVSFGIGGLAMIVGLGMNPGFAVPAIFTNLNSFVLMAIPFFIFAGGIMTASGISTRIVDFAHSIVGRFRGGLGLVTVVSCALFGAISGSSASSVATIGMTILPQMEKYGYKKEYSTALVACSGLLGQLIPPSIPMILFGMLTNTSVAGCFLAAAGPGILIIFAYGVINYVYCRRRPEIKVEERLPLVQTAIHIGNSAKRSATALIMPILVLGGIYGGVFTPTEAGCVAAVYAILVGVISRKLDMKGFVRAAEETASIEGAIVFIMAFIMVMSRIFTYERLPDAIAAAMLSLTNNKIILLLLINLFMILMGMIMDDISSMLIVAPLLFPLFMKMGISPYQMAAILAVNQGSGQMTPPVATNLFTAARVSGVPVSAFVKDCIPFLLFGSLPVLLLVTFLPGVSLWLPQLILGH
ncbi:MAG: TRAP transporter large permease [Deltaproteobacteria bacterium]|nr:TRAP transporter large permease [Deltaproteobacteria bacterium]MBW1927954.1 TRAP transporter large permease [Deltaproteobacteria bacterium]MBW2025968.1 TRAP transporter large permease [Deltaproteobacteria bacterium]MBW2127340.1 TRAP transporter large permease [Deltaproteobacteria bacterium]RLB20250.1 MAG: TRAP transporter large permease [Deltaproteobacteria bacterium]